MKRHDVTTLPYARPDRPWILTFGLDWKELGLDYLDRVDLLIDAHKPTEYVALNVYADGYEGDGTQQYTWRGDTMTVYAYRPAEPRPPNPTPRSLFPGRRLIEAYGSAASLTEQLETMTRQRDHYKQAAVDAQARLAFLQAKYNDLQERLDTASDTLRPARSVA